MSSKNFQYQGGYYIELVLGRKLIHKNRVEFYECDRSHSNYCLLWNIVLEVHYKNQQLFLGKKKVFLRVKNQKKVMLFLQFHKQLMLQCMRQKLIVDNVQGCYHRDLKSENIMFDDQATPKLIDFWMGKLQNSRDGVSTFKGQPIQMSPQNLRAQLYDQEKKQCLEHQNNIVSISER